MNLKERGIAIGDLVIISIIILTTTILVKTFKNDKKTSLNIINQEKISQHINLLSNNRLNNLSV